MQVKHITFILLLIVLIETVVLIFRKPETVVEPFDDRALREQIRVQDSLADYYREKAFKYQKIANDALKSKDSLKELYNKINTYYAPIYKYIPYASNEQLDSIVRANIKKTRFFNLLHK